VLSEEQKDRVQYIREQLKQGMIGRFHGANPNDFGAVTWYLVYSNNGYEGKNPENGINDRIPEGDLERAFDAYTFDGQGQVDIIPVEDAPDEIQEWAIEWGENVEFERNAAGTDNNTGDENA
jgi:hypothetical protein